MVRTPRNRMDVEPLEERALPSIAPGFASGILITPPYVAIPLAPAVSNPSSVVPGRAAGPSNSGTRPNDQGSFGGAFAPSDIRTAYAISSLIANGKNGAGQTIALIDAYDNPKFVGSSDANFLTSDLHYFDVQFGLPEPAGFFTKVDQNGGGNLPAANSGWAGEIALDVEWAHAIAPQANIVLVECNSNSFSNLLAGADWAATTVANGGGGASVVSMSFGRDGGFPEESFFDSAFAPAAYPGVTFVASAGDSGSVNGQAGYPADSPNVLAVGGTTLTVVGNGNYTYKSESVWNNNYGATGGGVSNFESQPTYQQGLTIHNGSSTVSANGFRAAPDVAFLADPLTGPAVYDSYNGGAPYGGTQSFNNWYYAGGTSLSAPCWAGLLAITDQVRARRGLGPLTGATQTMPKLYQMATNPTVYANDFHDVTSGNNGTWSAGTGYDLGTGLGTPVAANLVPDLAGGAVVTGVSSTAANGTYGAGATIPITVTFDVPVTVTGTPRLALNSGGTANYASGSGTSTLTFNYVVGVGEHTSRLEFSGTGALTLNGGTISVTGSSPTDAADLVLMSPGSPGSLSANKNIRIDAIPPNQPPFDLVPGRQTVLFNPAVTPGLQTATPNTVVYSAANGNAIKVTDPDSGSNPVVTALTVSSGSVTVPAGAPVTVTVTNNGTAAVTLTGPVGDITKALNGLAYTPNAGFSGGDTLTVSTNDQGYTGSVGPQTDTHATPITVVGLYLSEVMLGTGTPTPAPSQYVEVFSTVANYTIPNSISLVGVNGQNLSTTGALPPGVIQDLFNLGGLTTGANGYLALLEQNQPYGGAGLLDPNGSEQANSGTGSGFGNGGATSQYGTQTGVHQGGDRTGKGGELATDVAQGSESFLLVEAPAATAPAIGTNIDPGDGGTPDSSTNYATWNVLDSVGLLDNTNGPGGSDRSYAAITFASTGNATATTLPGSPIVSTGAWTASYLGRVARNTGSTGSDWLASAPTTGGNGSFVLDPTNSTKLGGQGLDHVGGPNYWAPAETVRVMDGTSNQHSQVSELTVTFNEPVSISSLTGAFRVTDQQGNPLSINVLVARGTDNHNGTASNVTVVQITFNGDATHTFGFGKAYTDALGTTSSVGLNDGNYFLSTTAADISNNGVLLDGARNGTAGSNGNDEFWRLFGDTLGRRQVDWTDNAAFVTAYLDSQNNAGAKYATYWFLDYNMDGVVGSTDRTQFVMRRGTVLRP